MLFVKWPRAVTILLLCLFITTPAIAQSLQSQQAALAGYEKRIKRLKAQQQKLATDLSINEAELAPLRNKKTPEKKSLNEAKSLLNKATAAYKETPTAENKAKKSNAAFKFALAERKFKKANARQFELKEQSDQISEKLSSVDEEISVLSKTISKQRVVVQRLRTLQANNVNNQREQQIRQKQREAELEIQRLKAELLRQKQLQAQKNALAKATNNLPPKAAVPVATVAPKATVDPGTSVAADTGATTTENSRPSNKTNESGSIKLTTPEQVRIEEQRLVDLNTKPGKKRSRYNKILNIKTVRTNGSISRPKSNTLRALGNNQYRSLVKLKKGEHIFIIGFNKWRERITSAGNTEYIIIYDTSNRNRPRLVYYEKSLSSKG